MRPLSKDTRTSVFVEEVEIDLLNVVAVRLECLHEEGIFVKTVENCLRRLVVGIIGLSLVITAPP